MPVEILMPALSPTMTEGNLAKWLKKEGDKVSPGDVIAEIETDKATMEVESVDEGTIGKIIVNEGEKGVPVNALIALLLEEGEDKKAIENYKIEVAPKPQAEETKEETKPEVKQEQPAPKPQPVKQQIAPQILPKTVAAPVTTDGRIKISPVAKRLAQEAGINISTVSGTGPQGRIVKSDIEKAIKFGGNRGVVQRDTNEYIAIENDQMRQVIAKRLLESKQTVPHFYLTIDCNLDKLLDARKDINSAAPINAEGNPAYKVTINDLIIKACALALKKIPAANASWTDEAILRYNNVDVSVAVALEGGLVTPIVFNADQKEIPAISAEVKDLAKRAKEGKLKPEEFQGGGFTISNLGMYGIKHFSAIINPPQGCILAVGAGEQKPIIKDGKLEIATIVSLTLSSDHRVVDGAVGAQFLDALKGYIEKPVTMLL